MWNSSKDQINLRSFFIYDLPWTLAQFPRDLAYFLKKINAKDKIKDPKSSGFFNRMQIKILH